MKKLFAVFCFFISLTVYAETFRYAIIPENPRPGDPVTIGIEESAGAETASLFSAGRKLSGAVFFKVPAGNQKPFLAAIIAIPTTAKHGDAQIKIENQAGTVIEIDFIINERTFKHEQLYLDQALTSIRADPDPVKTAESMHLSQILTTSGTEMHLFGRFIPPVKSTRRTSFFGDRREYLYSNDRTDSSIHGGIDYGVRKGTRVYACGPGRVVLARSRIVTGKTIVIDHLPGIYSLYYHLDQIEVREGDLVAAGTFIATSGNTGLSTAPHLHWELKVSGESADPDEFISRPILDKEAIISRIYE